MICFPLDNTEYQADALGTWCGTRTRGVFSEEGHYTVTTNGDMTVSVSAGLAWLKMDDYWGIHAFEGTATTLALDIADGELSRLDAICVRVDKNANHGEIVVKKGEHAENPTIEPPVRNIDFDEIYVATVLVKAGATTIAQADITDTRLDETVCGLMRDGVTRIPTQALYDQWHNWRNDFTQQANDYYGTYKKMVAHLYTQYTAKIVTHTENAQEIFEQYAQDMSDFKQQAETDFTAWWDSIKAILDEVEIGQLLNRMDAAEARIYLLERTVFNDITSNPFLILFDNLDGLEVNGIWNEQKQRIEV